jgi:hypothetical protein
MPATVLQSLLIEDTLGDAVLVRHEPRPALAGSSASELEKIIGFRVSQIAAEIAGVECTSEGDASRATSTGWFLEAI